MEYSEIGVMMLLPSLKGMICTPIISEAELEQLRKYSLHNYVTAQRFLVMACLSLFLSNRELTNEYFS